MIRKLTDIYNAAFGTKPTSDGTNKPETAESPEPKAKRLKTSHESSQEPTDKETTKFSDVTTPTTTTTTTTTTTATSGPVNQPKKTIIDIIASLSSEQQLALMLKLRTLSKQLPFSIGNPSVNLNFDDILGILENSESNGSKKLILSKQHNFDIHLDLDSIINNSVNTTDNYIKEILIQCFYNYPNEITGIFINKIDSYKLPEANILQFIASHQFIFKSISSIHIKEITTEGCYKSSPKIPNFTSFSCDKMLGVLDLMDLKKTHCNIKNIQFGIFMPVYASFPKALENLTITDSFKLNNPSYSPSINISWLPNLRTVSTLSTGPLFFGIKLPSLEIIDVFLRIGEEKAELTIDASLPKLKELHIRSMCTFKCFTPKNLPALEILTCPTELEDDPQIQAIRKAIEERKSL